MVLTTNGCFDVSEDWGDTAAKALLKIEEGSAEVAVGLCEQVIGDEPISGHSTIS